MAIDMNTGLSSRQVWRLPSERVQSLIRQGAEAVLSADPSWLTDLDEATAAAGIDTPADPVIVAAARRSNRGSIFHWASANVEKPGARVPAYVSADMVNNARELVRRGDSDLVMNAMRTVQSAAWLRWMQIAFTLTSDAQELKDLLEVSARSISAFANDNAECMMEIVKEEQERRARGTHADRRELAARILDGHTVNTADAGLRLGYALEQMHCAAIVWSEASEVDMRDLERAVDALAKNAASRTKLAVMANPATLWAWIEPTKAVDTEVVAKEISGLKDVRMAVGSFGHGVDAFRRSHLEALSAQSLIAKINADTRVVSFDQVRLMSLISKDIDELKQFIVHTIGDLANADYALRNALYTFLVQGCNAKKTAEVLFTHRNTLLRRLERAEEFLPKPLENNRVQITMALEALHWIGSLSKKGVMRSA